MYNPTKRLVKKIIILVLLCVILIVALYSLSRGTVIIKTDANTVIKITEYGTNTTVFQHKGTATFTTSPGKYTVTITRKDYSKQQDITIKAMSRQTIQLSIPESAISAARPEPVMTGGLRSLFIGQDKIQFLTTDGVFSEVSQTTPISPITITQSLFDSMQQNDDFIVAKNQDTMRFTAFRNGVPQDIAFPEYSAPASLDIGDNYMPDVTYGIGEDNSLFVSVFGIIYKSINGSIYKQIYDANDPYTRIKVAGSNILVMHNMAQDVTDGTTDQGSGITILDQSGKVITQNKSLSFSKVAISQDGSKIAILPEMSYDMTGAVYKTSDLSKPISKQNTLASLSSFAWYGNNRLVYGSNGSIWAYDTDSGLSTMLNTPVKNMNIIDIIQPQEANDFNGYVYFNMLQNNFSYVERVKISATAKIDDFIYSLDKILPGIDRDCTYSFINFVFPIITASGGDYTTSDSCAKRAPMFLNDNKIPSNKVTVIPQ